MQAEQTTDPGRPHPCLAVMAGVLGLLATFTRARTHPSTRNRRSAQPGVRYLGLHATGHKLALMRVAKKESAPAAAHGSRGTRRRTRDRVIAHREESGSYGCERSARATPRLQDERKKRVLVERLEACLLIHAMFFLSLSIADVLQCMRSAEVSTTLGDLGPKICDAARLARSGAF